MLLEFVVKNFRSLRDETALSLVASADKSLLDTNAVKTGVSGLPYALRVAAVYGANASGKSNLVRAIQLMRGIVQQSANLQPDQPLNIQPFKLDPQTAGEPTVFEITFLREGVRYQYGFKLTASRIWGEWLLVYKHPRPQQWFSREWDPVSGEESYEFGSFFSGQRRVWQSATKANSLYLSVAAQLNSELLTDVYRWITESLVIFENGGVPPADTTLSRIKAESAKGAVTFLGEADISISNIAIEEQQGFQAQVTLDLATGKMNNTREERTILVPKFTHTSASASAVFDFPDESEGTRKLFSLYGPLADIFENGKILIVDELDRSLHALLVRQIVLLFQDPEINRHGAQLILTTHDTSLLDSDLLRRDQIWFTEKDQSQASCLFPLSQFQARKNEAFEKGYLEGRYGAIPILRRLKV